MEVNAPQPEESTPRHQEDVKVDPWDLYVQAYQWGGQEVSKGKLSSRKAASEVYLRFGINLSHTTCAKAAEDEGAPPKKRGKATFVPPDVESKLVDFCIALRSLNFPIFKKELIGYCNTLVQRTKLVSSKKKKKRHKTHRWRQVTPPGTFVAPTVQHGKNCPKQANPPTIPPKIAQSEQDTA